MAKGSFLTAWRPLTPRITKRPPPRSHFSNWMIPCTPFHDGFRLKVYVQHRVYVRLTIDFLFGTAGEERFHSKPAGRHQPPIKATLEGVQQASNQYRRICVASRIERTTRLLDRPASLDCSAGEFWFMFGIDVDLPWEYFTSSCVNRWPFFCRQWSF